jgi:hypothetical protein
MKPEHPQPSPPRSIDRRVFPSEPIRKKQLPPAGLRHYIGAVCFVALGGAKAGIFRVADFAGKVPVFGISIFVILLVPAALFGAAFMVLKVFWDRYWYR